MPCQVGLLIGAALAPTDPAILIPLFERMRLRPKVSQTIIAESALNDPTGAVLALAVAGDRAHGRRLVAAPLSTSSRISGSRRRSASVFGVLLSLVVSSRRVGIWRESPAIAVLAVVAARYFSIDSAGGQRLPGRLPRGADRRQHGQLGLGMHADHERDMRWLVANVADVMVMFVFITLGANLPLERDRRQLAPGLGGRRNADLRRPPARRAGVPPAGSAGRLDTGEIVFIALDARDGRRACCARRHHRSPGRRARGARRRLVALAIIVTLALQSTTKPWLARRLGLIDHRFIGSSRSSGVRIAACRRR